MPNAVIPLALTGGVNLTRDAQDIRDDQVVKAKNVWPPRPGTLGKRPGTGLVGNITSVGVFWVPVSMLAPSVGSNFWVFCARSLPSSPISITQLFAGEVGSDPTVGQSLGIITPGRPALVPYRGKVYCFGGPGTNATGYIVSAPAAGGEPVIGPFAFQNLDNDWLRPSVACVYRDRMVFGNFGDIPGFGSVGRSLIVFSDDADPTGVASSTLSTDGRNFIIGSRDSDEIVAMTEIMLTSVGSAAESALLVLKRYSAYIITGEPEQSSVPPVGDGSNLWGDFDAKRVAYNCGCDAKETLITTKYGTIWAGNDEVWMFREGVVPFAIGTNIKKALARTPAHLRYLWSAGYHNDAYRLAVQSEDQEVNDDSGPEDQWWLDMREGPPQGGDQARWWGPMKFKEVAGPAYQPTNTFSSDTRPGQPPRLYSLNHTGLEARDLVEYDLPSVRDAELTTDAAYTYLQVPITMELVTKDHAFGDPMIGKMVQGLELHSWNSRTHKLDVQMLIDGGRESPTFSRVIPAKGFTTDVDPTDAVAYPASAEFQSLLIHATTRHHGRRIQLKISDTAGYVVGSDSDEFVFTVGPSLGPFTMYIASLSGGATLFADVDAYLAWLVGRMNSAAPGATFSGSVGGGPSFVVSIDAGVDRKWGPIVQDMSYGTEAQRRKTRMICAALGYDTSADPPLAAVQSGSTSPYLKLAARWEIGGLAARVRPYGRRPT